METRGLITTLYALSNIVPLWFSFRLALCDLSGGGLSGAGGVAAKTGDITYVETTIWLNSQYTNFGTVTEGMDIVNKIEIGDKILGITIE